MHMNVKKKEIEVQCFERLDFFLKRWWNVIKFVAKPGVGRSATKTLGTYTASKVSLGYHSILREL